MTMPKFEPVAFFPQNIALGIQANVNQPRGTKLFTESQLQQAYEAGKRDSVPEWFPIETAPKVGAHLACELPNKNDRRPYVIVWLDADHPDAEGAGWYEHWNFDPVEPTHWRPLPATPKGEKE